MNRTECVRCGECCRKGGPALHTRDMKLIEEGRIERGHLVSYLVGELLRDPVSGTVMPLPEEIIKLKTSPGTTSCVFYEQDSNTCTIYAKRPAECRAQKCWDPEKLLSMYEQDRLKRCHIVSPDGAMGDLMAAHEEKCSRKRLQQLARRIGVDKEAEAELLEMIRFDESIRDMVSQKAAVSRELMEFYFGRPVAVILPAFGLRIKRRDGAYAIVREEQSTESES